MSMSFELLSTPIFGVSFELQITNNFTDPYVVYITPDPYITVNRHSVGIEEGESASIFVTSSLEEGDIKFEWNSGVVTLTIVTEPATTFEFGRTSPYTIIQLPELPEPVFIDMTMRVGKVFLAPGLRIIYRRDLYDNG